MLLLFFSPGGRGGGRAGEGVNAFGMYVLREVTFAFSLGSDSVTHKHYRVQLQKTVFFCFSDEVEREREKEKETKRSDTTIRGFFFSGTVVASRNSAHK